MDKLVKVGTFRTGPEMWVKPAYCEEGFVQDFYHVYDKLGHVAPFTTYLGLVSAAELANLLEW